MTTRSNDGFVAGMNILLGNGDGTFHQPDHYDISEEWVPLYLIVDDFNHDSRSDIAATTMDGFALFLGLSNGSVMRKSDNIQYSSTDHGAMGMTHGDFDGDGHLDVAVASEDTFNTHVWHGVGDGLFVRGSNIYTSYDFVYSLTAGDYDADGDVDLAYGEYPYVPWQEGPRQLRLFFSNGDARTFTADEQSFTTGIDAEYASSDDIDGDGDIDILMGGYTEGLDAPSPRHFIFFNDGHGGFDSMISHPAGVVRGVIADVDRDGGHDYIVADRDAGTVNVHLNSCAHVDLQLTSSPNPSNVQTDATFTATVTPPPAVAPTGTLTLGLGGTTLGSTDLAVSMTVSATLDTLPTGTYTVTALYSGDTRFGPTVRSITHVVRVPPFGAPTKLTATSTGGTVTVTWSGTQGVSQYEVWRSGAGSGWTLIGTTPDMLFIDSTASPSTVWIYKARALPTSGVTPSTFSNVDLASTFSFTDPTVTAGTTRIRRDHLTELRNAVASARVAAGLTAASWAEANPTVVKASHYTEVRTALAQVRTALAMAAASYTSTPTAGSLVRAAHVMETRTALR